jgi:hypothetical protein
LLPKDADQFVNDFFGLLVNPFPPLPLDFLTAHSARIPSTFMVYEPKLFAPNEHLKIKVKGRWFKVFVGM